MSATQRASFPASYRYDELVFFATGTDLKNTILQFIANDPAHNLRIGFRRLDEVAPYHTPVEDGLTGIANVEIKEREAAFSFSHLYPGHSGHKRLKNKLDREKLIDYAPKHIRLLIEDTTSETPFDIWQHAVKYLSSEMVASLLYTAEGAIKGVRKYRDGKEYIVLADIGPILKAAQPHVFFEALRQGTIDCNAARQEADQPPYSDIPYVLNSHASFKSMSDDEGRAFTKFSGEREFRVYLPRRLEQPIPKSENAYDVPENYLCLPNKLNAPIGENLAEYLLKHSPQRQIFDQIKTQIVLSNEPGPTVVKFPHAAKSVAAAPHKPEAPLRILGLSALPHGLDLPHVGEHPILNSSPTAAHFESDLAVEHVFPGKRKPKHPDAIILYPFDPSDINARIHATTNFMKAIVAKQIDPRYYHVPIVVLNVNGCYDDILRLASGYAHYGFSGDYERHAFYDGYKPSDFVFADGVQHFATSMYDVLSGKDFGDLAVTSLPRLIDLRLAHYARHHEKPKPDSELIGQKPDGMFTMGYFSSAISERLTPTEAAIQYGSWLGYRRYGLVTGASDQYLMVAPVQGYLDAGGPFFAGFSTHGLITKETRKGFMHAGAKMSQVTRTIGTRIMPHLLGVPDGYVVWSDGGPGTGQEKGAVLSAKILKMPIVKDKPLFLFDPYAYDQSLKQQTIQTLSTDAFLGRGAYDKMLRNRHAYADKDIILATDRSELMQDTDIAALDYHARHRRMQHASRSTTSASLRGGPGG